MAHKIFAGGRELSRAGGISSRNREMLELLHRDSTGPFTVEDAAKRLHLDPERARRLLRYLAARGWLARARRGLYLVVPLDAARSGEWTEDPWVLATKAFAPCYIGGWSACEHWGLTDQLFRDVLVFTAQRVRRRAAQLQAMPIQLRHIRPGRLFGTRTVWRGRTKTAVSDPSRTVVDVLDDPTAGGGIRHVAEVLIAYFEGEHRQDDQLIEYAATLGNRTVYKRLGYLLEILHLGGDALIAQCQARISSGVTLLDPSSRAGGSIVRRWGLRINTDLSTSH